MDHRAQTYVGHVSGAACRFALVASRFNELVVERLVAGARDTLWRHGVAPEDIDLAWVPGAFEVPLVARRLAASGRYDAVICLGAVIRGATPHFDLVAGEAAAGVARAAWDEDLPVIFGVLTCDTVEQALDRAGSKSGNKGNDAALCALEMVQLWRALPQKGR